ncbi:MAG: serine/threonine-protein kinase [Verrucomicrobia bacterium]|nr:serine/threonine-protein kinase [Verrucomicrobiota bacterium]
MSQAKKCPECGAPILPDAPKGYCPACLVKLGAEGLFPADLLQTPEPAEKATRWPAGSNGAAYPTLFGDYELLGEIGRGGMGVVYKARQKSLNRIVAVKLMLSSGQLAQPEVVQRFRTEAQAIAHLQHPNIVAIHEVGEHDGQHYFSMEYVEGRTLAEMVRDGPLAATRAATYLKTISEAVHYAHAHGILHRDLKPSNVLIDSSDQPHITDFGLAKRLENSHLSTFNPQLTLSGQVLGSPNYLSPEQAAGRQTEVGPASDVYALGAMLYHLLTGRPPFQGDSLTALLRQVMETDPIGPRLLNPGIPRDLEMICLKCLEKDRSRRYETANGLALDIERHLGHEPVLARPQSRVYRLGKLIRRNKLVFTSGAAVFAALALGTLVSTWEALRANDARRRAERGEEKAKQNELAARVAETNALRQAYSASLWSACDALDHAQIAAARHYLESAPPDFRGWEWRLLSSRLDLSARVHEHPRSEHAQVHVLPDGRSYYEVCADPTNCIQRWDIETGQVLATIGRSRRSRFLPGPRLRRTARRLPTSGSKSCISWTSNRASRVCHRRP